MPRLIRDGLICEDDWLPPDPDASHPEPQRIRTLDQWLAAADRAALAVQLEPGQAPAPLLDHLASLPLVAVYFPVFTDGRGFSYGRELREHGFSGELRARGHFIRDQLHYLARCGFNAFEMEDEGALEDALAGLEVFSEAYQASIDRPQPLFRRR